MLALWQPMLRMREHRLRPFAALFVNVANGTSANDVTHHAAHASAFSDAAGAAGINSTVMYTDYRGMSAAARSGVRVSSARTSRGDLVYNYRSNHGWLEQACRPCPTRPIAATCHSDAHTPLPRVTARRQRDAARLADRAPALPLRIAQHRLPRRGPRRAWRRHRRACRAWHVARAWPRQHAAPPRG